MFVFTCVYIEIADFSTFWDGAIRVALAHLVILSCTVEFTSKKHHQCLLPESVV